MTQEPTTSPPVGNRTLRQRAEHMLHTTRTEVSTMDVEQVQRLVHELQVHQIELQMQNEELLVAQHELAQSLEKFSKLYDFAPVGYLTVDRAGIISQANLTAAGILQVARQSLALRAFSDWVAYESQDVWYLHRRQALAGDGNATCELTLLLPDNSQCVVRLESQAATPQSSETGYVHVAMLDITQEKEALEWKIQANRLQEMVEHLPAGAVFVDHEHIELNRTAELITGYSHEELPDIDQWFSKLYGDRAKDIRRLYEADRRAGFPQKRTCAITRKGGVERLIEFVCHGFDGHDVWLMHDITEQRVAEEQVKREKLLFESIVCSVPDALILASLDRQITFCNEGVESVFGYSPQELVGQATSILYKDPEEYLCQGVMRYSAEIEARLDATEIEFLRKDGQCFVGELRGTVLRGADGKPQGNLGLIRDVSVRKKLEAEQRRHNQVLEAIANGASLADVLQLVAELAQDSLPGSLGAILVLDQSSRRLHLGHAAALPPALVKAIDGLHTDIDRCGCTQAAATGRRVVIEDIAASPELADYGQLAQASGLKACWCQPILTANDEILGTLTLYFAEPRAPSCNELNLLEHAAQMSGIAIERVATNERIRTSEERLQLVTQASTDAIWDYNLVDGTVWWNTAYSELFGRPTDAKTVDWWVSRVHPDDQQRMSQSLRAFAAGEGDSERWTAEYRFQRTDGDFAHILDRALRSRNASGKIVRVVGSIYDLTERHELEKQVLDIASHERRRIGSDLHDGLGQELTGLSMVADALITSLSRKSLPEERLADKLIVGLQRALAQTRSLARGLNPVDIDARGLIAALEEMASRIRETYQVECVFNCEQETLFREYQTATQLFRIAQEATTNALRHGQAKHIAISLELHRNWAELRIVDDGKGFPSDAPTGQGMGLRIMRYRAGLFGGQLQVGSVPGGGTQVVCRVPSSAIEFD